MPPKRKSPLLINVGTRRICMYTRDRDNIMSDMNYIVQVRISLHSDNGSVVACGGLRNDFNLSRELQRILMDQEYIPIS